MIPIPDNAIQMYSGGFFDYENPQVDYINEIDIAYSLGMQCRFAGHCDEFYSVAQHSVLVSEMIEPEFALHGLLHDAAEAYVNDIPSPLKRLMPEYKAMEDKVWKVISEKFNLPFIMPLEVKVADIRMGLTENRDLLKPGYHWGCYEDQYEPYDIIIHPLSPAVAAEEFMDRLYDLL